MSPNRRIFLNIVATYGRSLYALVLGLFTGRWVLMALGQVDYGLYGLVGGLAIFISFFNGLLSGAIARFYAFEIGRSQSASDAIAALEECRKWFNTALLIHTVVPVCCIVLGYPVGIWAIHNFLEIPMSRVADCVWVFRFVCITCFVAMINVPFHAMYTAKQFIAELTIYGVATSTLQAIFLYYIASHPSVWLVRYSAWTCFIAVIPQIIICVRAWCLFPECHLRMRYCWNVLRIKQLFSFAGWHAFGAAGAVLRGQGIAILVNKYFGARVNAAMSVANTVNAQSTALVSAMQSAFTPAIVQACGAGDEVLMRRMAYRACKFGMVLALIFIVPLSLEIENVMKLWLRTPPPYAAGLCLCMLIQVVFDKSTLGHMIAVNAKGRIARYQLVLGSLLILTLPLAWLFVGCGMGVYSIGVALIIITVLSAWGRAWFAKSLAGMSIRYWVLRIITPVGMATGISVVIACWLRLFMSPSFERLCLTTAVAEISFLALTWFFVLDGDERQFIVAKFRGMKWRDL